LLIFLYFTEIRTAIQQLSAAEKRAAENV